MVTDERPSQNELWARMEVEEIYKVSCECDSNSTTATNLAMA